jgi:hypothetical protein
LSSRIYSLELVFPVYALCDHTKHSPLYTLRNLDYHLNLPRTDPPPYIHPLPTPPQALRHRSSTSLSPFPFTLPRTYRGYTVTRVAASFDTRPSSLQLLVILYTGREPTLYELERFVVNFLFYPDDSVITVQRGDLPQTRSSYNLPQRRSPLSGSRGRPAYQPHRS